MNFRTSLIGMLLLAVAVDLASAAELRLKPQARCSTGVVRLGDVAEIYTAEKWQQEQLAAIELGPAPATGGRRYIRAREVQDALWMRGINLSLHQLSGSDRIEVIGPGEPVVAAVAKPMVRIDDAMRDRAKRAIIEAIVRCLQDQVDGRNPWQVSVQPTEELVTTFGNSSRRVVAFGGEAPWTGKQRFSLVVEGAENNATLPVDVEVSLPPSVVTAIRTLSAGAIIHESDLMLKPTTASNEGAQVFYRLEDVVGRQTALPVAAGAVIQASGIRRPVVVRRGDAVTLYARSAGLRVRTTVRSREDGGVGDLIAVESLTNRTTFYARVTGIQEAEVYAAPAESAAPQPAADAAFQNASVAGGLQR